MCPRRSVKVQGIFVSSKTIKSQLSQLRQSFCHFGLCQPWGPLLCSMMILNGLGKLFVSMCTLKIQPYLPVQVLHVHYLFWYSQEGGQVRTCLLNVYSGKLCPPDLLFHSKRDLCLKREHGVRNFFCSFSQKKKTCEYTLNTCVLWNWIVVNSVDDL